MQEAKKWPVYYEFLFLAGLILISLGITLMVRADIGISVASSMPYVISLRLQSLSFGTWSYLVQGLLILLLVIIVRKVKISYLLSFLVSVAFGLLIDLFFSLTHLLATPSLIWRSCYYLGGLLVLSFGIALIIHSRLPPIPYDLFVKELALYKQITFRKAKTIFDLGCLTFSSLFLLFFVHRLSGIGIGSVLSALLLGSLAGFWLKYLERYLAPRFLFFLPGRARPAPASEQPDPKAVSGKHPGNQDRIN